MTSGSGRLRGRTDSTTLSGRGVLAQLRLIVVQQEAAAALDRRADAASSPVLAEVLRERALQRRGRAELIQGALAARGIDSGRPPWRR
jgi:hypothetical protein